MEATGSYWITLATQLIHAGFQVSVINPAQAHHFVKALLKRAKTDTLMHKRWLNSRCCSSLLRGRHRPGATTSCSSVWPSADALLDLQTMRPGLSQPSGCKALKALVG